MSIATQDIRQRAIAAYESGSSSISHIAKLFQVHRSTLHRWIRRYKATGETAAYKRGHNPARFSGELLSELNRYVDKNSDATLENIQEHFAGRVNCTLPTIHNTLRRLGWKYKKSRYVRASKTEKT